jgi:protein involved in polysaccharide export with SLBB domain
LLGRAPIAVFVIGFALLLFRNSHGQDFKPKPPAAAPQVDEAELAKELQKRNEQVSGQQAIEGVIDPATYLVGPGDVLRINFWGPVNEDLGLSVTITPEGKLIIPTVGVIDAEGKSLKQVQDEARQACASKYDYRSIKVSVHLVKLRVARAYIFGEVRSPGVITASSVDRVSYYVTEARGFTEWADERHLQVRHLDGTVDTLDMSRLFDFGDIAQDPYVRGGDIIYVPRIELTEQSVFVEGDMDNPGPHKIAPGETLLEFLHRIKAITRTSDLNGITLVRGQEPPQPAHLLTNGTASSHLYSLPLQNGDRIFVPPLKEYVYVHGAVKNPGNYSYVVGYKAGDYAGLAGGTVESANLKSIKVMHRETGKSEQGPEKDVHRGDTVVVPVSSRKTFGEFLTFAAQAATVALAVIAALNTFNSN